MIDLSEHYDSILVKQAGLHINAAQDAIERLEMFARVGDEAGTLACAQKAKDNLEKVSRVAAWAVLREED